MIPKAPNACVYCGSLQDLTLDHVPPKNLFPKPRPSDLITVPACSGCNSSSSKDDEYFRLKLCMSEHVGDDANARRNRITALESLKRTRAAGLRKSFLSSLRHVQLVSPAGLYLGTAGAFDVDMRRVFAVIERTTKGLFFHETQAALPGDYSVKVLSDDTLRGESADFLEELNQTILIPLAQFPKKVIGNGVFSYRFHITPECPFVSVWALTFYERISFLALTGLSSSRDTL